MFTLFGGGKGPSDWYTNWAALTMRLVFAGIGACSPEARFFLTMARFSSNSCAGVAMVARLGSRQLSGCDNCGRSRAWVAMVHGACVRSIHTSADIECSLCRQHRIFASVKCSSAVGPTQARAQDRGLSLSRSLPCHAAAPIRSQQFEQISRNIFARAPSDLLGRGVAIVHMDFLVAPGFLQYAVELFVPELVWTSAIPKQQIHY